MCRCVFFRSGGHPRVQLAGIFQVILSHVAPWKLGLSMQSRGEKPRILSRLSGGMLTCPRFKGSSPVHPRQSQGGQAACNIHACRRCQSARHDLQTLGDDRNRCLHGVARLWHACAPLLTNAWLLDQHARLSSPPTIRCKPLTSHLSAPNLNTNTPRARFPHESTNMANPQFNMLQASTSAMWLPSFQRIVGTEATWSDEATLQDMTRIKSGQPIRAALTRSLARWIIDEMDGVTTDSGAALQSCHVDECSILAKGKCKAKGWVVSKDKYVSVVIGYNEHGQDVLESAHRLVAWAKSGWANHHINVVMHKRAGVGPHPACRSKLCVNPHHLQWGTPEDNVQDYHDAHKRRGANLNL